MVRLHCTSIHQASSLVMYYLRREPEPKIYIVLGHIEEKRKLENKVMIIQEEGYNIKIINS